jgi:hypothetical protein
MNDSEFEKHLQSRPLRSIPHEWRAGILQQATAARHSSFVIRHSFLSTILWPHPKAWAGLAAVWVLIFALRLASQDKLPQMAQTTSPASQQIAVNLKEQQQILAELMGTSGATPEIDQPKRFVPQPHSELRKPTAMA